MKKAILFPSDFFSIREVDPCYQKEYEAAVNNGDFQIFFYDYEEFIRDGSLKLNRVPEERTLTILRGWMLKDNVYEDFYNRLLKRNIELITTPEQYANMHLFPDVYPKISDDTPGMIVYKDCNQVNLKEIKQTFKRFMVKDFVKSEKGTDFPKYFDSSVTDTDFAHWLDVFKEYRGKLFTGGICIKEFVDLKKYGNNTNEWRVFYMNGHPISVSRNSGQKTFEPEVPVSLIDKYSNLPSPFYTVDYAELEDGSWKILEAGDGQVSGLSDNQDADAFFRALGMFSIDRCLDCQRKKLTYVHFCPLCWKNYMKAEALEGNTINYKCPDCGNAVTTYYSICEVYDDVCHHIDEFNNYDRCNFIKGKNK